MEEETSKEVTTALASIFAGLAEFFGMFDMSFFVSGAACLGAIAFATSGTPELNTEKANNVIGFIILLTACYILGLLMFMIGRTVRDFARWLYTAWTRRKTRAPSPASEQGEAPQVGSTLPELAPTGAAKAPANVQFALRAASYGLKAADLPNIGKSLDSDSMYSLGWAMLRQSPRCQPSLRFINKYWVMAATYDGVAASAWVWMAAVEIRYLNERWKVGLPMFLLTMFVLLVVSMVCLHRAKQFELHQEKEMAATLAIVLKRSS